MLGASGALANDSCSFDDIAVTCSGALSQGISLSDPYSELYVLNLTGDISTEDATAIHFDAEGPVAVFSNTGEFDIDVTGAGDGIRLSAWGDLSAANLQHVGNINVENGMGIVIDSNAGSSSTSSGDISAAGDAINVKSALYGQANVTHTGDLTSSAGYGIKVEGAGSVAVSLTGNIDAYHDGINAASNTWSSDGTVNVTGTGSVTSAAGRGISAVSAFHAASVEFTGNTIAYADGVTVTSTGEDADATATLTYNGDVTSSAGRGIVVTSSHHAVTVTSNGLVDAYLDAVVATSNGVAGDATVVVDRTGETRSQTGSGIVATSANHSARVDNEGQVTAHVDGIVVTSTGDDTDATAVIVQTGNVTATTGRGISASSANRTASVTSVGNVNAGANGISAVSTGLGSDASAQINHTGNVTSTGGTGLHAASANASASTTSVGNISAFYDGIFVQSTGASSDATARVQHTGNIGASNGYGIIAQSAMQGVTVTSTGNIVSHNDGIRAVTTGNSSAATVNITHTGNVTSNNGAGIYGSASNEGVTITSVGNITGKTAGIEARSTGDTQSAVVRINHTGNITTTGTDGIGINAYVSNREAWVTQAGDITGGKYGIKAQSESEQVGVTLTSGTISGVSDAAVLLRSITQGSFDNYGTVDGGAGYAVEAYGYGQTLINNYGTVIGDVLIDDQEAIFTNHATGFYAIGSLGFGDAGGRLSNLGTLSPGGNNTISTATVDGDFVQSGAGRLLIDVNGANADRIDVAGTASLDGKLQLNFITLDTSGSPYTFLTSSELLSQNLELVSGVATRGTIHYVNGTDATVEVEFDFAPEGTNAGYADLALALNNLDSTGDVGHLLAGLANLQTIEEFDDALQQLSPEVYTENPSGTQAANMVFADRMLSCRVQDGAYAFSAEGECVWFNVAATRFDRDATADHAAYRQNAATLSFGAQAALDADWRFGLGFGYTQIDGTNTHGSTNQSDQVEAGAIVKYDREGTVLAASVSTGRAGAETSRQISFGGFTDEVSASSNSTFVAGRLHAAHTHEIGKTYVKPLAELNVMQLHTGAYTETGGPSALDIAASNHTIATFDPALEFGGELALNETAVVRPYIRAGLSATLTGDQVVEASFVEGDGSTFTIESQSDKLKGKLAAGADVLGLGDMTLRAFYEGSFSEHTRQHGVGVKLGSNF